MLHGILNKVVVVVVAAAAAVVVVVVLGIVCYNMLKDAKTFSDKGNPTV